jgi:hypothetical protein
MEDYTPLPDVKDAPTIDSVNCCVYDYLRMFFTGKDPDDLRSSKRQLEPSLQVFCIASTRNTTTSTTQLEF